MATVKKKLPYELYDVAGLEDWFSQMAAEGYHLVDCWQNKAEFTVATPKENVRFRLEAQETYQYDWNKDRAYAEAGWDHVTTIIGFFYIFRCDDPVIPEIHTDPTIQSWTMKKLIRRQWFTMLWLPLYWGFMMRDTIVNLWKRPMEEFKEMLLMPTFLILFVLTIFLLLYFFWTQSVMLTMFSRLKKRLASGLPMDRTKRYPRRVWRHFSGWIVVAVYAVLIGIVVVQMQRKPLEVNAADYPHVSLEDVVPGQYKDTEEISFWTGASLESSFFVPVHFEYGDAGVQKETYERARTYLHYYEASSPWVAKILLKGSIEERESDQEEHEKTRERYPSLQLSTLELSTGPIPGEYEGLDELYRWDYQYSTSELNRVWFGRKGNKVFVLYTILPEPEAALDLLIEKIQG